MSACSVFRYTCCFYRPDVTRPTSTTTTTPDVPTALHKPTTRTLFADRAFCCTAPTVGNSLSNDVVSSTSLAVFKSTLKTFLFRQTFRPIVGSHGRNLSVSASGVFDILALYKIDYYYYYYYYYYHVLLAPLLLHAG